ncbi:MAG: RNA polymerase sigma factor [Acidimicrobiales bacterium]
MPIGSRFDEVLAGARQGDEAALEIIYRDLAPLVIGYLRSHRAPDPDDLASDVFIAVVRNVAGFSGAERQFRSWVLTIAHRRLIDEFRRRGRRPEDPTAPDDVHDRVPAGPDAAADGAMENLATESLQLALDRLTEDQRAVITLRILGDVPIKDVAAILDKPETAVKSLQHRALARLAQLMATEDPGATRIGTDPGSDD